MNNIHDPNLVEVMATMRFANMKACVILLPSLGFGNTLKLLGFFNLHNHNR
jgi:hypothetical protein